MALTADQRDAFWREGYLLCPELLREEEVQVLRRRIEEIVAGKVPVPEEFRGTRVLARERRIESGEAQASNRLDELRKFEWPAYVDPLFYEFAKHPRIVDLLEDLLGTPDIKLLTDQVFLKPPFHGSPQRYHQDVASWPHIVPHDTITCWIALDAATVANGCLRYLPQSHRLGLILGQHVPQLLTEEFIAGEVTVEVPAGGCVLHHGLTFHSSGPNTTPYRRRGWALHYVAASSRDLSAPGETGVGTGGGQWECISVRGRFYPGRV